jgi:hypothetical protein
MPDRLGLPDTPEGWERLRRRRVVATPDHVEAELHGEAVILHLGTRQFHGLEGVGARIWQLLKQPITVAEIRDAIVREYDVTPERCEADLAALLDDLVAAGLVQVPDGDPA